MTIDCSKFYPIWRPASRAVLFALGVLLSFGCERKKSGPAVPSAAGSGSGAPRIEFLDPPRRDPDTVAWLLSPGVYAVVARWVNESSCEPSGLVAESGEKKVVALLRRGFSADKPFLASIGCRDLEACRDLSQVHRDSVERDPVGVAFDARVGTSVAFGHFENRNVRLVGGLCRRRVANGSKLADGLRLVLREHSRAPAANGDCEAWTPADLEKATCRLTLLDLSFREPVTVLHSLEIDDCETWRVCPDHSGED